MSGHNSDFICIQPDQMAVFFWYLVKSDLSIVRYCTHIHWTSHFLQGTRKTEPCLTGHSVPERPVEKVEDQEEDGEDDDEGRVDVGQLVPVPVARLWRPLNF